MSGGLEGAANIWNINHSFGAIAYSRSSGRFDCSWWCTSYDEANRTALSRCGAGGEIVVNGQNYHLALALGSAGSWGTGKNVNARYARREALRNCGRYGSNARIVLLVQTFHGVKQKEEMPAGPTAPLADQSDPGELLLQRVGWGAISCSPSTRLYSYAINESSAESAGSTAIRNCRQPDAIALTTGFNTHLALARCSGGFGSGRSDNSAEAEQAALRRCAAHGFSPQVLLVLHTLRGVEKTV